MDFSVRTDSKRWRPSPLCSLLVLLLTSVDATSLLRRRGGASAAATEGEPSAPTVAGVVPVAEQQGVDLGYDAELSRTDTNTPRGSIGDTLDAEAERVVRTQWNRHRRWSNVAKRRKDGIFFYRGGALFLVVAGAACQTLAAQLPAQHAWVASVAGGTFVGAAPLVTNHFLSQQKMLRWVNSRAASEGIKAEVYKFQARVKPYHEGGGKSIERLVRRSRDLSKRAIDPRYSVSSTAGPPPPPKLDRESYLETRLERQMNDFYRKNAMKFGRKSTMLKSGRTAALAASSAIGFLSSQIPQGVLDEPTGFAKLASRVGTWGVVLSTMAAAVSSHLAATRYDETALEYSAAAEELQDLADRWPLSAKPGSEEWSEYVLECEGVISSTNTEWSNMRGLKEDSGNMKGKSGDTGSDPTNRQPKWNANVICGDEVSGFYNASARAEWLMENKGLSQDEAQKKVMREYPTMFLYDFE